MMNLDGASGAEFKKSEMALEDRWILSRLGGVRQAVTEDLEGYRFSAASDQLYNFFWHDMCDWYLEVIKPRLADAGSRPTAQRVLAFVLDNVVRLWHPFMCFQTEAIYQMLGRTISDRSLPGIEEVSPAESIMISDWPGPNPDLADTEAEETVAKVRELVTRVRNLRAEHKIPPQEKTSAVLKLSPEAGEKYGKLLQDSAAVICGFAGLDKFEFGADVKAPEMGASDVVGAMDGAVLTIARTIDPAVQRERLEREIAKLRVYLAESDGKLANENFTSRAPANVVQSERERAEETRRNIAALEAELDECS
jgi:valyl-tRNA synthetase